MMGDPPIGEYEVVPTFLEPDPPDHRAQPLVCKKQYLPGDWGGLMGLAGELYAYARGQKSSGAIPHLVGWVKDLVEHDPDPGGFDGQWIGAAAHVFTQTFTVDAALMNGLNKVICAAGSIIDDLGSDLADCQHYLEVSLEDWGRGIHSRFTLDWLHYDASANFPLLWDPPGELGRELGYRTIPASGQASEIRAQFMKKADDYRTHAGAQLTAIANLLFEGSSFYINQSKYNSKAPENLLSSEQAFDLRKKFDAVQNNLKNYSEQLNASSDDAQAAADVLTALGAKSGDVASLIKDIKDVKEAEGFLQGAAAVGTTASVALPELAEIGLAFSIL